MSLFERIQNLWRKSETPGNTSDLSSSLEKSFLTLSPGDIVEVSLVTYQVTGRARHSGRNELFLTIQDGTTVRYLHIEEREQVFPTLYTAVDGRLDMENEIPSSIELDGTMYYLEEQYSGPVRATGKTPFPGSGDQYVWMFQSDDRRLLRIEWQDGRIMMYEGESLPVADLRVIRGT